MVGFVWRHLIDGTPTWRWVARNFVSGRLRLQSVGQHGRLQTVIIQCNITVTVQGPGKAGSGVVASAEPQKFGDEVCIRRLCRTGVKVMEMTTCHC